MANAYHFRPINPDNQLAEVDAILTEKQEVSSYEDKSCIEHRDQLLYEFYKQNIFCDVSLVVRETRIRIHSVILISASEYFRSLFDSKCSESNSKTVDYSHMFDNVGVLKSIIEYMYTGEIALEMENIVEVLHAAGCFMLMALKQICAEFLALNLRPLNSLYIWQLSNVYDLHKLKELVAALLEEVFCKKVIEYTDLTNLPAFCIEELINHRSIFRWSKLEDIVFLITAWSSAKGNRENTTKQLMLRYLEIRGLDSILYKLRKTTPNRPCNNDSSSIDSISVRGSWDDGSFRLRIHDKWTILMREKLFPESISFFCEKSQKWIEKTLPGANAEPLGIIEGGYLILYHSEKQNIELLNLKTFHTYTARSTVLNDLISDSNLRSEPCKLVFYCHSSKIYANFMTILENPTRSLSYRIFNYSVVHNNWSQISCFRESLKSTSPLTDFSQWHLTIPCNDDFIFGIGLRTNETRKTSERSCVDKVEIGTEQVILIKFSLDKAECRVWSSKLLNEREHSTFSSGFVLRDRIVLVEADCERVLFNESDFSQTQAITTCYSVSIETGSWIREQFHIPVPNVSLLPLDFLKLDVKFPSFVSRMIDRKIILCVHKAPCIFQIHVFDLLDYKWVALPPCSLSAATPMTLSYIKSFKPVCQLISGHSEKNLLTSSSMPFHSDSV